MKVHSPLDSAVCRFHIIAAAIATITRVQRHVNIANKMGEERERHQSLTRGHVLIREQLCCTVNLTRDAISVFARGGQVKWLTHIGVLIMP